MSLTQEEKRALRDLIDPLNDSQRQTVRNYLETRQRVLNESQQDIQDTIESTCESLGVNCQITWRDPHEEACELVLEEILEGSYQ